MLTPVTCTLCRVPAAVEQVLNIAEQHKQQQQLLLRVKSEPRTDENGTWLQINT